MSDVSVFIYLDCENATNKQRLEFYFNEETRPDFEDEVPSSEAKLFEVFESMPEPNEMEAMSDTELALFFECDGYEALNLLPAVLNHFNLTKVIVLEDCMDYRHYKKFNVEDFELFHSPKPLEDEGDDILHNRVLTKEQIEEFEVARERGRMFALQYLAKQL